MSNPGERRHERLLAGAVALALVGGLVSGMLVVLQHIGARAQAGSGAGGAHVGANGPADRRGGSVPVLGDGSFVYRTQSVTTHGSFTAGSATGEQLGFTITTWWANDGSGRFEHRCVTADCESGYGFPPSGVFGPGQFPTDDDMSGLSSDPAALLPQLEARTAPGGRSPEPAFSPGPELTPGATVGSVLDAIVNILEDPNGSPGLKAACFEVARGLPSVEESGGVSDPAGRPAVRLRFSMDTWGSVDYFFDPGTHLLMATSSGAGGSGSASSTTIYSEGIVDSTDATPTGDQWLFPAAEPTPSP